LPPDVKSDHSVRAAQICWQTIGRAPKQTHVPAKPYSLRPVRKTITSLKRSPAPASLATDVQTTHRFQPLTLDQGGPRSDGQTIAPGTGNCLAPATTSTVCKRPSLQHGHIPTSMRATRAIKACADSSACGFSAGIRKANRAALSCLPLHAEANTP